MKSLHSVSKITLKWNLTKSHATRLKSAKYKTHGIKEQLLKWMSYNKINQSHGSWWNYDKREIGIKLFADNNLLFSTANCVNTSAVKLNNDLMVIQN